MGRTGYMIEKTLQRFKLKANDEQIHCRSVGMISHELTSGRVEAKRASSAFVKFSICTSNWRKLIVPARRPATSCCTRSQVSDTLPPSIREMRSRKSTLSLKAAQEAPQNA